MKHLQVLEVKFSLNSPVMKGKFILWQMTPMWDHGAHIVPHLVIAIAISSFS